MSYQCKNCDREKDQNNNYVNATYAANVHGTRGGRGAAVSTRSGSGSEQRTTRATSGGHLEHSSVGTGGGIQAANTGGGPGSGATQVTAKVMWGSVGAIKELREKEQAERNQVTRAGRRQ
ncbi:uncharacterized protein LOC129740399 [Uranotaenia lowii]|uniref:uncharacterized protein LOC129740399 n=1 Tax=Uranotaenia lowii TaxID=190385 RepID=UPI00247ADAC8|nr:uncharacterized protein LOC129740399 [Uranotaenia lowii]